MKPKKKFEFKDCIVCGIRESDVVYKSTQYGGKILGKMEISLSCCKKCGFVWQNPQLTGEVLAEYYENDLDASGSTFHFGYVSGALSPKQKNRIAFFLPHIKELGSEGHILEIGCSTGDFLVNLDLPKWSLYGLEPSKISSKIAAKKGIFIFDGVLEESDLPNKKFDVVAIFSVIEHLSNLEVAMSRLSQIIKAEGLLLFEVPDSLRAEPQAAEFFTFEHLWHFTRDSIVQLLKRYGFNEFQFDESVTDARMRCVARRSSSKFDFSDTSIEFDERLPKIINEYEYDRSKLVEKIKSRIKKFIFELEGETVAFYGGGIHTYNILALLDNYNKFPFVVDSNKEKWGSYIAGIPIISLNDAFGKGIKNFIISSNRFESEIYEFLSQYPGLKILRLYDES